jgi:hypothetical protein
MQIQSGPTVPLRIADAWNKFFFHLPPFLNITFCVAAPSGWLCSTGDCREFKVVELLELRTGASTLHEGLPGGIVHVPHQAATSELGNKMTAQKEERRVDGYL